MIQTLCPTSVNDYGNWYETVRQRKLSVFGISTLVADREQLSISILNLTLCLYFQHIKISLPVSFVR